MQNYTIILNFKRKTTKILIFERCVFLFCDVQAQTYLQIEIKGLVLEVIAHLAAIVEIIAHAWLSVEAEQMAEVELHAQTTVY